MNNRQKGGYRPVRPALQVPVEEIEKLEDKQAVEIPPVEEDDEDNDWLNGLTPFETAEQQPQQPQSQQPPQQPQQPEQQQPPTYDYDSFEHLDEDVAREVAERIVAPKMQAVLQELEDLKTYKREQEAKARNAVLGDINKKIQSEFPDAAKIFQSIQFRDYVNSFSNPYANETEFEILIRAYNNGDYGYVKKYLDDFVRHKGKPKIPMSAESKGGQSAGYAAPKAGKKMTFEEYQAKKMDYLRNRHKYPQGYLRTLAEEYDKSLQ